MFEFGAQSQSLVRRVYASRAVYDPQPGAEGDGATAADPGWTRTLPPATMPATCALRVHGPPARTGGLLHDRVPEPRRMTYPQLSRYIAELRQSGYDVLGHEVELYRKVAFPFVTLVMTCIAVPFAVTTGRRGAMYGIGVGIVLALVYWTMISVFAAFGAGGVINPMLAAWAPNLLFGAAALYLLLTVRT
ncbi:MAG: LptF/LptG family permease [Vicinamibacterales bacterium]